tara:strand:- start:267 stop:431 length:165 start_codon:yes stop_codon:yes gene_type:complete
MDTFISAGSFGGAAIAFAYATMNKPSWEIVIAYAVAGAIIGIILSKIVNKIKRK